MNQTWIPRWFFAWVFILFCIILAGCESPALRHARRTREQSLARSIRMVARLEEGRTEMLARTVRLAEERYELDRELLRRDLQMAERLAEREVEEWARKEPVYRRNIERYLLGDPASIERTWPYFVY